MITVVSMSFETSNLSTRPLVHSSTRPLVYSKSTGVTSVLSAADNASPLISSSVFGRSSRLSSSTCDSISELITLHTDAITSFFLARLIRRTPCVARPITRHSATDIRITMPLLLIIIKSLSSVTFLIATSLPVLSVIFSVLTPYRHD